MPREVISGLRDCAKALSIKRECSIAVARDLITDMLDVMVEEIERLDGVQFVNLFTIKKIFREERHGYNPATEEPMYIPARWTLRLTVGKGLLERKRQIVSRIDCANSERFMNPRSRDAP
jgi:nucleoid DNA-binding protein